MPTVEIFLSELRKLLSLSLRTECYIGSLRFVLLSSTFTIVKFSTETSKVKTSSSQTIIS